MTTTSENETPDDRTQDSDSQCSSDDDDVFKAVNDRDELLYMPLPVIPLCLSFCAIFRFATDRTELSDDA